MYFLEIYENEEFDVTLQEFNMYIVPLPKQGSVNEANNNRGITLLSTLGKLLTRVLNNRLGEWAENYSVYIEAQAGFRTNMGTTDRCFCTLWFS